LFQAYQVQCIEFAFINLALTPDRTDRRSKRWIAVTVYKKISAHERSVLEH